MGLIGGGHGEQRLETARSCLCLYGSDCLVLRCSRWPQSNDEISWLCMSSGVQRAVMEIWVKRRVAGAGAGAGACL